MIRKLAGWLASMILAVALSACGDSPPPPNPINLPPTLNPSIATINANAQIVPQTAQAIPTVTAFDPLISPDTSPASLTPTPVIAPGSMPPRLALLPGSDVPLYPSLVPLELGSFGSQLTAGWFKLDPTSAPPITSFYVLSANYPSLTGYYNAETARIGYRKAAEQKLPEAGGLAGNTVVYVRGTGSTAEVMLMMAVGPLSSDAAKELSTAALGNVKILQNQTLVLVMTNLTGGNLAQIQQKLKAAGDSDG